MTEETPRGEVYTFYSYKGGVGRTFALANVAVVLARWGYRVLCIDWDLEAPGLHLYFDAYMHDATFDLGVLQIAEAARDDRDPDWRSSVVTAAVPETELRLALLPAGNVGDPGYVERLQNLDWPTLYEHHDLGRRLETMRGEWIMDYDFVLIDSRTGITDIGGICTVQLPDVVVALFTANQQSLDGVLDVVRRAEVQRQHLTVDRARLRVLPIATRFEATVEVDLAHEWLQRFEERLPPLLTVWNHRSVSTTELLNHLLVPYVAHWSFGERLPVVDEGTRNPLTIGYAFETVAALVGNRLERTDLLVANRQAYVDAARSHRVQPEGHGYAYDVFVSGSKETDEVEQALVDGLRARDLTVLSSREGADGSRVDAMPAATEQARNLVVVIGDEPNRWLEEEARSFIVASVGADTPRLLLPVRAGSETRALPRALASLQVFEAHALDGLPDLVMRVARRLLEQRLELRREELGESDVGTLSAMESLAVLAAEHGDVATAVKLETSVVELREAQLGPEHPDTMSAMTRLSGFLASGAASSTAQALLERVIAVRRSSLGRQHPETLAAVEQLESMLSASRRDTYDALQRDVDDELAPRALQRIDAEIDWQEFQTRHGRQQWLAFRALQMLVVILGGGYLLFGVYLLEKSQLAIITVAAVLLLELVLRVTGAAHWSERAALAEDLSKARTRYAERLRDEAHEPVATKAFVEQTDELLAQAQARWRARPLVHIGPPLLLPARHKWDTPNSA